MFSQKNRESAVLFEYCYFVREIYDASTGFFSDWHAFVESYMSRSKAMIPNIVKRARHIERKMNGLHIPLVGQISHLQI